MRRHSVKRTAVLLGASALVAAFALSCATFKKKPEVQPSLAYRWQVGVPLRYEIISDTEQSIEAMGQTMNNQYSSHVLLTYTPKEVRDDGAAVVALRVDSISVKAKTPMGDMTPDVSSLKDKEVKFVMTPAGKVLEVQDADQFKISLGRGGGIDLSDNLRRIFTGLPGRPVEIGEKWSSVDTFKTKQGGMDIQVIYTSENQAVGKEMFGNATCTKIHTTGQMSMDGSGEQMGNQISFEGDGEVTSDWLFDPMLGRLMHVTSVANIEGTIAVSGQQNMTMPMESTSKTTVKVLLPES